MLAKVAGSNQFKVGQGDKTWNELEYVASIAFGSGLALDADGKIIVDFSQMPTEKFEALLKSIYIPILLKQNTNFYVDGTAGSDVLSSNRGLSADIAFKTIQACVNYVCDNYNLSRYNVTINVAAGVYESSQISLPDFQHSTGSIRLVFNENAEVLVKNTNSCFIILGGTWNLYGINAKLECSSYTTWISCLRITTGSSVSIFGGSYTLQCIENASLSADRRVISIDNSTVNFNVWNNKPIKLECGWTTATWASCFINVVHSTVHFWGTGNDTVLNNELLFLKGPAQYFMKVQNFSTIGLWIENGKSAPTFSLDDSFSARKFYLANYSQINSQNRGQDYFPGTSSGEIVENTFSKYS